MSNVLMFGRRTNVHAFDTEAAGATGEGTSPFTAEPATPPPLAAVLAGEPALLALAPVLEEAAIDVELATEMTATELATLLPVDTPIGHALRVRKLCKLAVADAARLHARVPKSAAWQQGARIIAVGTQQGDLSATVQTMMDMTLIVASLFLTMTLPFTLDCPESCSDGSECRELRSADLILWALQTGCFLAAVLSAWINLVNINTVSRSQRAMFFSNNWGKFAFPTGMAITGISALSAALVTRMLIGAPGGPAFSVLTRWSAIGIVVSLSVLGGWVHHVVMSRATLGIKWCEFPSYQGGVMGSWLPRDNIGIGAECRRDPPYFDP